MHAAVLRYRVMAYITGVLIIVVCFVGIPMQIAAHNAFIVNDIGTVHGFLYIVYIIFAYILAQKLHRAVSTEIHGCIELLEIFEVDDCRDDAGESSLSVIETARQNYCRAILGARD